MLTCPTCKKNFTQGIPFCPHCGADAPTEVEEESAEARDPLVGRVLANKFKVLSVLGDGGMGRVYRAEQVPLAVEVVIKTLHKHMASEPEVVKRFFREAQSASRLRHPNCIAILDFGESEGTIYMAMEFLRGKTLGEMIEEEEKLPPKRVVHIIAQALDVIEAAHRMSIIHRDLKPENIMVEDLATHRDFVKVLDFGIAKIVDPLGGGARLTQTGMIIGTPAYMSPEQARGEEIDTRTDIYSIGVICFELLTGRLPFLAETSAAYLAKHLAEQAPPLRSVCPEIPPELAAIVDSTLSKDPEQRPQTALDLKEALLAATSGAPAAIAPAPGPSGAPRTEMIPGTQAGSGPAPAEPPPPETQHGLGLDHPPCPRCGVPVPPTAKFCPECGAITGKQTRSTKLGDKFSDLRRFLPSGLIDEISQVKARGPSEKREIVVMVVDVSGPALHGPDTEQSSQVLAELFAGLNDIALRHTGSLERRPDDTCIIAFGLEISHADDAERAVRSALDLRTLAGEMNQKYFLRLDVTCAIHVGGALIETGESSAAYSPVGDTVELPTRLAAASEAGRILVSDDVRQLVHRTVKLRRLASVRLKGRSTAVSAFEVLEAQAAGTGLESRLSVPPLVGRETQLESVLRLLANPQASQTVHVVGEPGSGKTRFLQELAEQVAARRVVAISTSARPEESGKSRLVAAVVRALGGTSAGLRALGVSAPETRVLSDYFAEQTGQTVLLTEKERSVATGAVLRAALERLASRRQLVLLVDDVHLADPTAAGLVHRFVSEPVPGLVLVAASRDGYPVPWGAERASMAVLMCTMSALSPSAIAALVEGSLTPTPPPQALTEAVVSRAGGSPLVAVEVMRSMVDSGLLSQIGGRWTLSGDPASFPKPEGLRALYAARIDALSDYARDVLACAAVVGEECELELLNRVVGEVHGTPVDREVHMLVARGLLTEVGTPGQLQFAEQSTRDIVYDRLPRETRTLLHTAIATAMEGLQQEGTHPPEVIGEHYFRGKDFGKALEWLARGARAASDARELGRAERILRRAREAAQADLDGPQAVERNRRLAEDSLRLGDVLLEQGALTDIREVLTEGLVCAQKDDDPALIARVKRARGRALLATGDVDGAFRDLEQANQAAIGLRDRVLLADLNGDLGELYEKRGNLDYASRYLVRALELVQGGSSLEVKAAALRLLTALGRVSLRSREVDKAERFLEQALALAEDLDDGTGAAKVLGNLAGVHHARKDYRTAMKFAERALQLARDSSDHVGIARQLNNLGTLSTLLGDAAGARRYFDAAFKTAKRAGWREGMATAAAGLERLKKA